MERRKIELIDRMVAERIFPPNQHNWNKGHSFRIMNHLFRRRLGRISEVVHC